MDRIIEKKKWTLKKIVYIAGGSILAVLIIYSLLFADRSAKLNVKTEKITISKVQRGTFQEFIPVTGTIMPIKTIYLDAMEGGRVDKLYLEQGAMVKQGDEILKLTNTNLQMDVMFREAQLFEQINNLRNTRLAFEQNKLKIRGDLIDLDYEITKLKRAYDINEGLMKQNLISPQEYEQSRDAYFYALKRRDLLYDTQKQDSILRTSQMEQLELSVSHMQNNLNIIKENMASLTLRAPVSGQLTSRNAELGESKRAGDRLGQIDVLDGFKVRAGIDEHYISRIQIGQTGEFDLAGKPYKLIVKKIYPEVSAGKFDVDMEFEGEAPKDIRRGQTLQVRLELGDLAEALLLARGGFYQKTGGQWAFVVDPSGGFAVKRAIKLGRQNPQVFEVIDGLYPGEDVITSSYDNYGEVDKLILQK